MEVTVSNTETPHPPPAMTATTSQYESSGSSIQLPKQLEAVKVAQALPQIRHRWNTNEEIASILIAFSKHREWQHHAIKLRPPSGCMLLFNRNHVRYRKDGYCWKKRKDGKTIREDHMKLKVQGLECIYGSYVHSGILPTFHRRCYWLLQNPDIVLVHYLNVPYPNHTKLSIPVVSFSMEKKEWTKDELIDQLTPMFSGIDGERIPAVDETILTLVQRLIEHQDQQCNRSLDHKHTSDLDKHHPVAATIKSMLNSDSTNPELPSTSHSNGTAAGNHSNQVFGLTHHSQNQLNLAQGPLILTLGNLNLTQPGVMVVTGRTDVPQLSIMTNNSGQLTSVWSSEHLSSSSSSQHALQQASQHASQPSTQHPSSTPTPAKSFTHQSSQQTICEGQGQTSFDETGTSRGQIYDTGTGQNVNMYNQVNSQRIDNDLATLQNFQSQKLCSCSQSEADQRPVASQISSMASQINYNPYHGQNVLSDLIDQSYSPCQPGSGGGGTGTVSISKHTKIPHPVLGSLLYCQDTRTSCGQDFGIGNDARIIENSSNVTNCETVNSQGQIMTADALYQPMDDAVKHDDINPLDSLVEELNLQLMSTDKDNQTKTSPPKRSFEHLGDSFESIQASLTPLPGSDLNLEQLDLIDLPELEKICNDISNNTDMNSHTAQDGPSEHNIIAAKADETGPDLINAGNLVRQSKSCSQTSANMDSITQSQRCVKCDRSMLVSSCGQMVSDVSTHAGRGDNSVENIKSQKLSAVVTDFSPDWAYTEGQTKLLVTGPWNPGLGTYMVLLSGKVIATTLVQPGVLRCFVPGHRAGLVPLQVSCDGHVISNTVMFEYKEREKASSDGTHTGWFSVDNCRLQEQLVNKLEHFETALSRSQDLPGVKQVVSCVSGDMDLCLSQHLETLSRCLWTSNDISTVENGSMGLSMLHLAAALGYHRLTKSLIIWRTKNHSWLLEYEVDASATDLNCCTPLTWACARGHTDTAMLLYNWNKSALHSFNREGNLPLFIARQHGHHQLADQLEQLDSSGALSNDIVISQANESTSAASLYSAHTHNYDQDHLCSYSNTTNQTCSVRSTPDKTFFPSDSPTATSTPVSVKDQPSEDVFKSPQSRTKYSKSLGALHIEIPAAEVGLENKGAQLREKLTRRQSDQTLKTVTVTNTGTTLTSAERRKKLKKRLSVDTLPNGSEPVHFSPTSAFQRPVREANSEPHLRANFEHLLCESNPMLSEGRTTVSPELLMQVEGCEKHRADRHGTSEDNGGQLVTMDTDDISEGSAASFIDVEKVSSDDDEGQDLGRNVTEVGDSEDPKHQMVHLAKQIIAAMPERIKSSPGRTDELPPVEMERERSSSYSSLQSVSPRASSSFGEALSSYGEDSGISTPMRDSLAFDEYRYSEVYSDLGTPASSLSPDSTCLHSPYSPYSFHLDSPPPTAADFLEYFNAPATFMEKDFSQLTLSDREQRKLYEAAKVIQSAYRTYRNKQCKQQNREIEAAVLIQSYYRRYKQYAYYKKMTQAAVLIQSQFRSYYAQKRFKKSRDAAVVIQNQYRSYKEHERLKKGGNKSVIQRYRSHYQRKVAGAGKGSRVVQIVPDTGDGCPPDPGSSAIDDCPLDTNTDSTSTPSGGQTDNTDSTVKDSSQGE